MCSCVIDALLCIRGTAKTSNVSSAGSSIRDLEKTAIVPIPMIPRPETSHEEQKNRVRKFFKPLKFDSDCSSSMKRNTLQYSNMDFRWRTHSPHYDVTKVSKAESSLMRFQTSNQSAIENAIFSGETVENETSFKYPVEMDKVTVTPQLPDDVKMNNIDDLLIGLDESTFGCFKLLGP